MARSLTILGTMSNVGKSVITAGLCRLFKQDGWSVAPFKSQNMALNSFITREGLEIGRAQAMQAEAAGVEPSHLMNPILLKPTGDTGSQVIVNGEVWAQMSAAEYQAAKPRLKQTVLDAFNSLASAHDVIVIEGAGGAAEINLMQDDLVNIGMARAVGSPVLLVGDIDRGGVFAQLYGTVALLEAEDRAAIKGTIVNKFRGDISILEPGLRRLEELTEVPVIGVVPYTALDIDDEDSLTDRFSARREGAVDIAVIRLPRISNHTDFDQFSRIDGVSLRYVGSTRDFGDPDMIIIPGTKNTLEDLRWLRESGIEPMIARASAEGRVVFGICGGYQMLGEEISDPHGTEGGGTARGLALLPVRTVFEEQKTRTRVRGTISRVDGDLAALSGMEIVGYEIHMGATDGADRRQMTTLIDETSGSRTIDGAWRDNIYGSYVHGFFDADGVARTIADSLAAKKGITLTSSNELSLAEHKERQYDALASALRRSLDIQKIYSLMEAGI